MLTDQKRAEFEAWANGRCELHLVNPAGRYSSAITQFAWEAYQAGRAALADADLAARQRELQLLDEIEALERLALRVLKQLGEEAAPQPPAVKESLTPATVNQELTDQFRGATQMVPAALTPARHTQAIIAAAQLPEPDIDTANHAGVRVIGYTPQKVRDLLATQAVNQPLTAQVPPFTHTAKRKLDEQLAKGWRITGYAIERTDVADWAPQRGFVTHGGLVGWWTPHQIDRIPGAQHCQPT